MLCIVFVCVFYCCYHSVVNKDYHKTGNISETVKYKAKVTINGLYKVVHGLSIAAIMYYLE